MRKLPPAKTPTVLIARILRGLGLNQGRDFRVAGRYANGERRYSFVYTLNTAAERVLAGNADEIERLADEGNMPFTVSIRYYPTSSGPCVSVHNGPQERVREAAPQATTAPVADAVKPSDTHVKNVLRVAREAGFVATHYHGGSKGTTQLSHDNGNILFVTFVEAVFTRGEGRGWGGAPWTGAGWSTDDYATFTRMILT
jgi:hypothetical protein